MERLTKRWEKNGSHYHCLVACEEICINNGHTSCYCDPITEVRLKLAAYEDTGLTPDEIASLREKQEREKGCEYCDDNFKFWQAQISGELPNVRFCPMCGRGLEVQHE